MIDLEKLIALIDDPKLFGPADLAAAINAELEAVRLANQALRS